MTNPSVKSFFTDELARGRENLLTSGDLYCRIDKQRRYSVGLRRKFAYVWQPGSFERDLHFWQEKLSNQANIAVKNQGRRLSFRLTTDRDFTAFSGAPASARPGQSVAPELKQGAMHQDAKIVDGNPTSSSPPS